MTDTTSAVTTVNVRVSAITAALLDTARSRRDAVRIVQRLYCWDDGAEISREAAVEFVEAYYAQNGGKPWLRKEEEGSGEQKDAG